ncbi:glutaredoxin family protein [Amycolatopsis sp. H20-H5]|uniref:glutaredoxin family protein n=1 Tax=Amycolatopsis sp. H20-H5 TaxID=3046309 RepID=UPI002DB84E2B|nr:hypothetical protein [Amycolatopsis sp. H20-H5]MEC3982704.1 hypothetical protein [Amycolatopsis sp. H20-H5]
MTRPLAITLLTQHVCAFCDHAKGILDRVGTEFPLRVTEVDLSTEDGQRVAIQAGMLFAPGVFVEGRPLSYGRLSERKLRRTLEKHLRERPARS